MPYGITSYRLAERGPQRSGEVGGRAISARNATTHGLFARDVVLPALGEDPAAFDALLEQLIAQLPPRNLLERHYLEQIAAASWRLRRLHRWQAQIYEDGTIDEDQRLDRLDKTLRHETTLTRQSIRSNGRRTYRAVRLLGRDLSDLFHGRARDAALRDYDSTEADCRQDPDLARTVRHAVWASLHETQAAPDLQGATLDNTCPTPHAQTDTETGDTQNCENENCENEPPPPDGPDDLDRDVSHVHPDGRPVFLDDKAWRNQTFMRSHGDHARADEHADHFRRCFLSSQQSRRAKKCENEKCQNEPPRSPPCEPRSPWAIGFPSRWRGGTGRAPKGGVLRVY